jgi:hypothetical protein
MSVSLDGAWVESEHARRGAGKGGGQFIKGYSRAGTAAAHSNDRLKRSISQMLPKGISAEVVPKVVIESHPDGGTRVLKLQQGEKLSRQPGCTYHESGGVFMKTSGKLVVSMEFGPEEAEGLAWHEAFHALDFDGDKGLFTPKEREELLAYSFKTGAIKKAKLQEYLSLYERQGKRKGLTGDELKSYVHRHATSEVISHALEKHHPDKNSPISHILDKIRSGEIARRSSPRQVAGDRALPKENSKMTKLENALREKFATPAAAIRALGLDEALLREDGNTMSKRDKAVRAGLKEMLAQDASLAELTEFLQTLNATGGDGAAEEGGEFEDEDGEDEIPGAVTEPNAGVPPIGGEGEGEHSDEVATDEPAAAIHAILKDKLSPDELARIGELLEKIATPEGDEDNDYEGDIEGAVEQHTGIKPDGEEKTEGEDEDNTDMNEKQDLVTRPAMDEAIRTAVANAEKRAAEKANALRIAERTVEPYVGKLALDAALDADGVYRKALTMLGVEGADTVHPSALTLLLKAQPLPGSAPRREPRLAQDAATVKATLDRFPNAGRLKRA